MPGLRRHRLHPCSESRHGQEANQSGIETQTDPASQRLKLLRISHKQASFVVAFVRNIGYFSLQNLAWHDDAKH